MEPAVRGARIEPAIIAARLETAFFASRDPEFPNCQTAFCRPKPCRRERNFWRQRPEAKNPPERALLSAETGNLKIGVKNPRRNGLFSIGDGFRGLACETRAVCVVPSLIREGRPSVQDT